MGKDELDFSILSEGSIFILWDAALWWCGVAEVEKKTRHLVQPIFNEIVRAAEDEKITVERIYKRIGRGVASSDGGSSRRKAIDWAHSTVTYKELQRWASEDRIGSLPAFLMSEKTEMKLQSNNNSIKLGNREKAMALLAWKLAEIHEPFGVYHDGNLKKPNYSAISESITALAKNKSIPTNGLGEDTISEPIKKHFGLF